MDVSAAKALANRSSRTNIAKMPTLVEGQEPNGKCQMKVNQLLLNAIGVFLCTLPPAFAGEFPDSWTWDDQPAVRATHAALEGKPMPALEVTGWINGEMKPADLKGKVVV